jgi:sialate O-acetylesterase
LGTEQIYDRKAQWEEAKLLSVKTEGDEMILTFDKRVHPDDQSPIIEGFALAGEDGKYYKAYARHSGVGDFWTAPKPSMSGARWCPSRFTFAMPGDTARWATSMSMATRKCHSRIPHGLLGSARKRGSHRQRPHQGIFQQWNADGKARLEYRRTEEAKRALEIIERLKTLGKPKGMRAEH